MRDQPVSTFSRFTLSTDEAEQVGRQIYQLVSDLYPICRSITGNGVRETLAILQEHIPLQIHEVPSETQVFDWTVPKEWNIRDAYIKESKGVRVVDFRKSNLHVVSYSVPVKGKMPLSELKPHLHSLPEHPDWIPYRTSYYQETWGFCLSHKQLMELRDDEVYEVCIDSTLEPGSLTYGEYYLPGASEDEVLISCHVCHPSLCNDNLSGVSVATFLASHLRSLSDRRYSYRFLFVPVTIGAISWLCLNEANLSRIKHGLVLTLLGDPGKFTYKKSRRRDAEIDRAAAHVLKHSGEEHQVVEFTPYGYDERQFCSPGFNLPVGCLMRTPHGQFPEYHTSADNPQFLRAEALADSLLMMLRIVTLLEANRTYLSLCQKCEPQLGKRGLYSSKVGAEWNAMAIQWVLNLSDGDCSLLDIADRANLAFGSIASAAEVLLKHRLIRDTAEPC